MWRPIVRDPHAHVADAAASHRNVNRFAELFMKVLQLVIFSGAALAASASMASADRAVGLVGDNTLVLIEGEKPGVTKTMTVTGVDRLLGIDVRPSNKMLYGVTADGTIVTIDTAPGKATTVSKADKMPPASASVTIDFNPAADRLRFMGSDGTNLRGDVDTGKFVQDGTLAFEKDDMHAAEKPNIVAAAYTNSFGKPEKTAMYDIDATIGALVHQTKPNDGSLKAIGKLGIAKANTYAFDIHTSADGKNTAWLAADNKLYSVALETGKASLIGEIAGVRGAIRDIAVLPGS